LLTQQQTTAVHKPRRSTWLLLETIWLSKHVCRSSPQTIHNASLLFNAANAEAQ
jgi:hypothetical protein